MMAVLAVRVGSVSRAGADGCTGNADNPTAPAGEVCIHLDSGIDNIGVITGENMNALPDTGFYVSGEAAGAAGPTSIYFTWAHTAPSV